MGSVGYGIANVDTAATLAEARERMRLHAYGIALVDWGLPDGTSEGLTRNSLPRGLMRW